MLGRHAPAPAGRGLSRMGSACRFAAASFDAGRGASAVNRARRFERTSWDQRGETGLRREPPERMRAGAGAGFDAPRIWRRSLAPALAVGLCLSIWVWRFRLCRARRDGLCHLSLFCVGLDRRPLPTCARRGSQKAEKKSVDAAFADFRGLRRSSHEHSCEA